MNKKNYKNNKEFNNNKIYNKIIQYKHKWQLLLILMFNFNEKWLNFIKILLILKFFKYY